MKEKEKGKKEGRKEREKGEKEKRERGREAGVNNLFQFLQFWPVEQNVGISTCPLFTLKAFSIFIGLEKFSSCCKWPKRGRC